MTTRFENVNIDARDFKALAAFWCEALGWEKVFEADDEISISNPGGDVDDPSTRQFPDLVFVPVEHPEDSRDRIHLDLASTSVEDQQATVARLLDLGATPADVGQAADAPFTVLADPEGNAFCVLDPRDEYRDTGPLAAVVVAAVDAQALREFWLTATGWDLVEDTDHAVSFRHPNGKGPLLEIITRDIPVDDPRKNRVHLDVAPARTDDQAAEVARLVALGAVSADVGQSGDEGWVVLADPEGNEVCVLSPRD